MPESSAHLRILIVSHYYWPENFRINDLAACLAERGHRVTVLTGVPNYPRGRLFDGYSWFRRRREDHAGVRIIRAPVVARGSASKLRLALNYFSFAMSASVLGPLRVGRDHDVVLAFQPSPVTVGIPAIVMKRWMRAPLLFWVQDLWPETLAATGMVKSRLILSWVHALTRWIYRRCDRILVQSEAFVGPVLAVHGKPGQAAVDYVPNWAESLYRPVCVEPGAPEEAEMPPGFRILFGGSLGAAQSFETILDAAHRLRGRSEFQWIIVGDGHQRGWLEQKRVELGLEGCMHLLGSRPPRLMPRYFSLADALLVTLRADPVFDVTVPSKVQSYLASGRPVVAALNGEGRRIIEESGAGIAVPAGDSAALADAVTRMYALTAEQRGDMARNARGYYERHFEREKVVDRVEELMTMAARGGQ